MRTILITVNVGSDARADLPTRGGLMYICLCNAITDRQIVHAAEHGARTQEDLAQELGVGLGCGRCTSCAKSILVEAISRLSGASCDALPPLTSPSALATDRR